MSTWHINLSAIAILLLLWVSSAAQAQEKQAPDNPWSVGVKGGPTFSFVSATNRQFVGDPPNINSVLDYTAGVSIQYLTERNFGFQVELNYAQKGWKQGFATSSNPNPVERYQVSLNYAEVPILAHGYVGKRNLRLFINAGVYVAYLLNHNIKQVAITPDNEEVLFYEERFQNKVDFGVRGGGGFEVVTKIGMFQAEGSFSWGVNSILDKDIAEIPNIVQNLATAITLGYYVQF